MAPTRHEFKLDNGNKFYIRRYDAFLSLKILGEVQKRFLGPLAAIMEARDATTDSDQFTKAVDQISKGLDGDSLVALAKTVLNSDYISVVIDDDDPKRLDEGSLNLATDGIFDVVSVIFEVLRYNYSELFTRGRTLIGRAQDDMAIH
jgi:tail assembly chaperone